MIKLELKNESKEEEVLEKTVTFEFRRHKQDGELDKSNLLFLVIQDFIAHGLKEVYPIKIDGDKKEFIIKKNVIERSGFKLIIQGERNVS